MATVVMTTHGTHGDVLPFIRLGATLRGRGHTVTLLTHHPYGDAARAAGIEFVPIDTAEEYAKYLRTASDLFNTRGLERWDAYYRENRLYDQMRLEFDAIAARHKPGDTVVVGRHTSALSALFAREALGVPVVWLAVAPIQYMMLRAHAHALETALRDGLESVRSGIGLPPVPDLPAWLAGADTEVGFWPRWFDRAGARSPARVQLTGFPLLDEVVTGDIPADAAELLAGPVPPVLVSGGTGRMLHRRFYELTVQACAELDRPALLVTPHRDLLPDPLPSGMRWFPALPFRDVMPRVGAVLHHGGIGTLARALAAGTAQVILPHGFDRPDNLERLRRVGLADGLPAQRWEAPRLAELLRVALTDIGYRDRAAALDGPANPLAEAADAIEGLLTRRPPSPADLLRRRLDELPPRDRAELARRLLARRA
jgi:rhamnosyltransferase subunit B